MRRLVLILGVTAVGCGGGAPDAGPSATTRDSAGIAIVENTGSVWAAGTAWQLSAEPTVAIGVVEGEAAYELFRVVGAVQLGDGRIVVGVGGAHELRFFDADGQHVASVGREGSGPGEFTGMGLLQRLPGDSLLVYDFMQRRVSIVAPDAQHVRDRNLLTGGQPVLPLVVGYLGDDAYLARISSRPFGPPTDLPLGELRDSIILLRIADDGATWDTVLTVPGQILHVQNVEFGGRSVRIPMPAHFGPTTAISLSGGGIVVGHATAYEIKEFGRDGGLRRILRKQQARLPVTPADVDSALARLRAQIGDANLPSGFVDAQMNRPVADSMPAYVSNFTYDLDGNLWIEEFRRPGDDVPQWSVFNPAGHLLGVVTGPPGLRLTDVGRDYVLGIIEDELEVERVVRYALIKPTVD
jgi:hypothetical protein